MNKYFAKTTLVASLLTISAHAVEANTFENPNLNGLKVAIIKDAAGTEEILAGDYDNGLNKISNLSQEPLANYEYAMGICVANIKLREFAKANNACSKAIDAIESIKGRARHGKFLKSMAYSNRAIVRYLSKDSHGALEDFAQALMTNSNHVVKGNIATFQALAASNDTDSSATTNTFGD